jgi:hypothetical protein
MDTGSAPGWLAQHGFTIGQGPAGTFRVGWHNGGPGGGHMAATLPDGTNFESGGSHPGVLLGAGAAGADDKQFDQHAYLPLQGLFPDGRGGGGAGGGGRFGIPAGATPGVGPGGEQGYYTAADPKKIREANERVADADARVREADARVTELKANASQSEKLSAQNQADKAKREAADARADLEAAQKGEFHEGRSSSSGGSGGSGMGGNSTFGQLGGIAGQFINDTFGFGSLLPDLDKFPPLQFLFGMLGGLFGGGSGGGGSSGGSGGGGGLGGLLGGMMGGGGMVGVSPAGVGGLAGMIGGGDKAADTIPGAAGSSIRTAGGLQQDNSVHVNVTGHSTDDVTKQVVRQVKWAPRVTTNAPAGWGN